MIILVLVCFYCILLTDAFVLLDPNYSLINDSVNYIIDFTLNDDNEMIKADELKNFTLSNKLFEAIDRIAMLEYYRTTVSDFTYTMDIYAKRMTSTTAVTKYNLFEDFTNIFLLSTHTDKKVLIKQSDIQYDPYNYNDFLNEYNQQVDEDLAHLSVTETPEYGIVNSFKLIFLLFNKNTNYNKSIGLQKILLLADDYQNKRRPTIGIVLQLWRIVQIWFLVYLAIALPLWCTRGWCCCCLFCCKFCKPRQTIDEAKKYVLSNPPGSYNTKNGVVLYDPTEREIETYEEFEHFIKTL